MSAISTTHGLPLVVFQSGLCSQRSRSWLAGTPPCSCGGQTAYRTSWWTSVGGWVWLDALAGAIELCSSVILLLCTIEERSVSFQTYYFAPLAIMAVSTTSHCTTCTSKLKELQRSKSRCKQLLLASTTTPNFVVFRSMVPKKRHEIFHRWP